MGWPEVFKALHLLLPFIRELFFGKRRVFRNLSKEQIDSMVTSLGIGIITLVAVSVLANAIHKEAELNAELQRLRPYEEVVATLNETYGVNLMEGGALPIDTTDSSPLSEDYDALWQAYKDLIKENRELMQQCYPATRKPGASDKPKTKPSAPHKDGADNRRILEKLEGLW